MGRVLNFSSIHFHLTLNILSKYFCETLLANRLRFQSVHRGQIWSRAGTEQNRFENFGNYPQLTRSYLIETAALVFFTRIYKEIVKASLFFW